MTDQTIYQELAQRTNGACMLGVVGPVRTGRIAPVRLWPQYHDSRA